MLLFFYDMGHIYCYRKRFSSDMSCHKSPPCKPIMNCFHNLPFVSNLLGGKASLILVTGEQQTR